MNNNPFEEKVKSLGKEIFKKVKSSKISILDKSFLNSKLLELGMKDDELKVHLFRFIDVLPSLKSDEEIIQHIQEYFSEYKGNHSEIIKLASELSSSNFLLKKASAITIKNSIEGMSRTFIGGENVSEVITTVSNLRKKHMAVTVDILGETVLSEVEAKHYLNLYLALIKDFSYESKKWSEILLIDNSPHGKLPKANVSIKVSSLFSQGDPINFRNTIETYKERLRMIFSAAIENDCFVYLDMEDYQYKDIILTIFKEILLEDNFKDWKNVGIVIQAYLKDSEKDLIDLINWTKLRKTPVSVRLVKGAYWDYENITSRQKGWIPPVFLKKYESDINFENLTKILIDNYPILLPAIASHNIRSLSFAKIYAQEKNIPQGGIEYQFLYGMADGIKNAFVELNERVRVYVPCGKLLPGMAYLVRRLLENTANDSFLKQGFTEGVDEDKLLKNPEEEKLKDIETVANKNNFVNEPELDFRLETTREKMSNALIEIKKNFNKKYPLIINGERIETSNWAESINPSCKKECIGKFSLAEIKDADKAISVAKEKFKYWSETNIDERTEIFLRAAQIMREKKHELAALIVYEVGKPWREADGDVAEAIDFLNYYCLEAKKLFTRKKIASPLGEENYSFYQPRGVASIISPWNFPLAILTGMSSAALITGNTAILKPAKQSSIIAYKYMEILEEAGLPKGACNYLSGEGKIIGNYLCSHKDISIIAFTGSVDVGLSINKIASEAIKDQNFVKKSICEMGGKNAIIIDNDADLDEAVKGVLYSAFGYAGQKCSACSRVIVLKSIYEDFIKRLVEATKSIKVGSANNPENFYGPLIDEHALNNTLKYIDIGKKECKLLFGGNKLSEDGYFLEPTIFCDVNPNSTLAQEEIFAPVLSVIKAEDLNEAIKIASGVKYALTGGLFSRSPNNIEKVKKEFKVGNLYINRGCTGAKVQRQPFGGFKLSGIGSKAGGEDYLLQFIEPRVITENTMRRGFAPGE